MQAQAIQRTTRPTARRAAPRSGLVAPLRPVGTPRRHAAACEAFAGLRPAQLLAGATPALLRVSHVCGSIKQQLGDAIDSLDGQKAKRMAAIKKLYHAKTREELEEVLADDFVMGEAGYDRRFTKADYIGLMAGSVLPAVPDFSWSEASNGDLADDGFCVVVVAASGHHTGTELRLPGLEPLPPSGKHFCLAEEVQKVRVDTRGRVAEIVVLPAKGAGPRAMYAALGGKLPPAPAGDGAPPLP